MNSSPLNKNILPGHYILRFIFDEFWDIDSGRNLYVLPEAFRPRFDRSIKETELSVTWVENFQGSTEEKLKKATNALCTNIRPNGKFCRNSLIAKIKVDDLIQICSKFGVNVVVKNTHSKNNPAHSSITFFVNKINLYKNILNKGPSLGVNFTDMNKAIVDNINIQYYTLKGIRGIK